MVNPVLEGKGVFKAKISNEKYEAKGGFFNGRTEGGQIKNRPWGIYGYLLFLEQHIHQNGCYKLIHTCKYMLINMSLQ